MTTTKILVVDNYDSFVYTLVGYLQELGAETTVVRNDDVTLAEAIELAGTRDGVLISPGPGNPAEAGVCIELIRWCGENSAEAFGGKVTHAPELMHGKTSLVEHIGTSVFSGLPSPVTATRYHSLAAVRDTLPDVLEVTAETATGVVMGLQHRTAPLCGVQFHPESVLTEGGYQMLGNWLESLGMKGAAARAAKLSPLIQH
jgi:para-aminobenzoate synthetase component 2